MGCEPTPLRIETSGSTTWPTGVRLVSLAQLSKTYVTAVLMRDIGAVHA